MSERAEIAITIGPETPLQDDVRAMIKALNDHLSALSPPEFCFQMTAEQIAETATTLFVARDATGRAIAMGALKRHADGIAEVKRMFTRPELRGQHIGRAVLKRLEDLARSEGFTRLCSKPAKRKRTANPGGCIKATASPRAALCSTIPTAAGTRSSRRR